MWKTLDKDSYDQYAKPMNQGLKVVNKYGDAVGGWNTIGYVGDAMEHYNMVQLI